MAKRGKILINVNDIIGKRLGKLEVNAININNVDTCIMCGAIIPEGRQVCPICENKAFGGEQMNDRLQ